MYFRKRRASNEGSRSPSVKKARDGSPALSTHSKKSSRDVPKEKEPDADVHSEKVILTLNLMNFLIGIIYHTFLELSGISRCELEVGQPTL